MAASTILQATSYDMRGHGCGTPNRAARQLVSSMWLTVLGTLRHIEVCICFLLSLHQHFCGTPACGRAVEYAV